MRDSLMWLKKPVLLLGTGLILATVPACPDPDVNTELYTLDATSDIWGDFEVKLYEASAEPVLTSADVKWASLTRSDDEDYGVSLALTEPATDRFRAFTEEHIDEKLAIVVGGQIVAEPIIRERIEGGSLFIEVSDYDQACDVFDAVRGT
jgi:preprotein translocase subunit SecD